MLKGLETPTLVLDKSRLHANAARFLKRADAHAIELRPHLKTAKSMEVARIATGGRMSRVTVSTLKEAQYFAHHGFTDILVAAGTAPNKFAHAKSIIEAHACDLIVITDNVETARAAAAFAEREEVTMQFLVELDCGEHRGGVPAQSAELLAIAQTIDASPNLVFKGVMTHAGHSYATDVPAEIAQIAQTERETAVVAAQRLGDVGIGCDIVSVGSTPTFLFADSFEGLTEVRCGVYMFFDLAQYSRGVCTLDELALTVLATIIGHNRQARSLIVDAGAFALTKDFSANAFLPDAGYGYVCDIDTLARLGELSVKTVHQEHGTIPLDDEAWFDRLPIGSQVRILPNHACATASAYERYTVIENGAHIGTWDRVNGWQ